ncbi:MAG: hypothetical protein VX405_09415, partial [Myxococcota bacterium]|nr:hypothetical protein [Myxococcota bacterium]
MRSVTVLLLCISSSACVETNVDAAHPENGLMHYPSGLCASKDWVHVVSSNHDQRFASGALLSFRTSDLAQDRFDVQAVRHGSSGLPSGFGRVLDLVFCESDRFALLDRAQKLILEIKMDEQGSISDDLSSLIPVGLSQSDPGRGVVRGDWTLLGSRIDEAAAVLGPASQVTLGEALARRPVQGGNLVLPVTGLEAVGIGEDGTSERLYQVGWNGSLDALARSETTGVALHRTGKSVIEYRRVGQNLVMESSVDLSAQHRRLMRGYSGGAVEEHWYFGGEPVVEVYWGQPQRLMELWFDPRFIRLESGIPLGDEPGSALFTSFVPAGLEEGAPLVRVRASDRSVELLR